MSEQLFKVDTFRKELVFLYAATYEHGSEIVSKNLRKVSDGGKSAGSSNFTEHYLPRTVCFCTEVTMRCVSQLAQMLGEMGAES